MWLRDPAKKRNACRKLARRHSNACTYCGVALTEPGPRGETGPTTRTIDHILARSRGGANNMGNLTISCAQCNVLKGSTALPEFIRKAGTAHQANPG